MPSSSKKPFALAKYNGAWYGVACLDGPVRIVSAHTMRPSGLYQLVKKVILSVDMVAVVSVNVRVHIVRALNL
jgi:hypothetical protein